MTTRHSPPLDDAAAIARAEDAATIAIALFARIDEDGKGAHSSVIEIEKLLIGAGVRAPPIPHRGASIPMAREDRYRGSRALGSGRVQEIGNDGALAETYSATILGVALVVRLRADGRNEVATAVAVSLERLGIDTHGATIGPVDPDPHRA